MLVSGPAQFFIPTQILLSPVSGRIPSVSRGLFLSNDKEKVRNFLQRSPADAAPPSRHAPRSPLMLAEIRSLFPLRGQNSSSSDITSDRLTPPACTYDANK